MSFRSYRSYYDYVGDPSFISRFESEGEMESKLSYIDLLKAPNEPNQGGMPLISDTENAYVDKEDYHTLILGSTGSKKTRLFVLPTIFTLGLAGEDMVIADPKGELYDSASA